MKKGISTAIVLLGICSVFLYVKNAGGRNTAEEVLSHWAASGSESYEAEWLNEYG